MAADDTAKLKELITSTILRTKRKRKFGALRLLFLDQSEHIMANDPKAEIVPVPLGIQTATFFIVSDTLSLIIFPYIEDAVPY